MRRGRSAASTFGIKVEAIALVSFSLKDELGIAKNESTTSELGIVRPEASAFPDWSIDPCESDNVGDSRSGPISVGLLLSGRLMHVGNPDLFSESIVVTQISLAS